MLDRKLFRVALALLIGLAVALPTTGAALAAPPANDNFADATMIGSLPFSGSANSTEATAEFDEPQYCFGSSQTVWWSFTPTTNGLVRADTTGSDYYTNLNVYEAVGPGFGGLNFLGCAYFAGAAIAFNVQAGTTYYLQAESVYGTSGNLQVNLQEIPPPPNDNFAAAPLITVLPFSDTVDTSAATREAGEPTASCAYSNQSGTAWYAFMATTSGSVSAYISNPSVTPMVAAYTGSSLAGLTQLGCRNYGRLTFHVDAGNTYYFQVSGLYDQGGSLQFNLEVAPSPVAGFYFYPGDPSAFDTVQFYDNSYDPGEVGFQSWTWNFGDGATDTVPYPAHRYATDGVYTVQLTVTTVDGRTASTSQVVQVRTHDVAITKIGAPQAASAGQTRQITVEIRNNKYPETVQVQLFKSVPGGFQFVGSYSQSVPVRPSNRTTTFSFNYTFTSDDASAGKVTFKAVASIVNARDAWPADNEAIASPTKVK